MIHKYLVSGLDCPNCAKKLAGMIEKIEGVGAVKLNFLSEELTITSDADEATLTAAVTKTAHAFDKHLSVKRK